MREFAQLLETLILSPGRIAKLRAMQAYFHATPDPERGLALAALTGQLNFPLVKSAALRTLAETRIDGQLFHMSYDFVGDLAETLALAWPQQPTDVTAPHLTDIVETLTHIKKTEVSATLAGWLDACSAAERIALLKIVTGNLRIGVGARLVRTALADAYGHDVAELEEIWATLTPPFLDLFQWLEGHAPRPALGLGLGFRPLMLAHPLEEKDRAAIDAAGGPTNFAAEWKWDGIRVQWVLANGDMRMYSRGGEEVSATVPEFSPPTAGSLSAVLDGELLVKRGDEIATFNDLQQRLNRRKVTPAMLKDFPAHIRLYDLLQWEDEDLRALPYMHRRERLAAFWQASSADPLFERIDLSPELPFATWDDLAALRADPPHPAIEGLMLKRRDSPYLGGRVANNWYKWKRNPLTFDCVLMYAQRGHGKRSSYYSDFTYGCWAPNEQGERVLLPVGKAYGGYTDKELLELQKFINRNTVNRFGPVRELAPKLVFEIACDAVQSSTRHKSGVALRFPRINRIRWDKPAREADTIDNVRALIAG